MKRIQPAGKSDACLENSDPTLEDSGFFGTPGARSEWDWSEDRRASGSKAQHLWQTPAKYIRNKWKGRASFVEDESSPWMRKLGPQHILKSLVVLVILASLGFAVLTYSRHIRGAVPGAVNSKYKSIEFGRVKRSAQLEEEGKLIKDIVDDEGNELGVKKAAIQFGFDLNKNGTGNGLNEINKDDLKSLLELEAQLNEIIDLMEGNVDSELIKKREAQTEGFRYAAESEGDEDLVNLNTRDVNDDGHGFRFVPEGNEDLVNLNTRDVNDDGHGFRFVPDDDTKYLNKRNSNDEPFRYVADNSVNEDTFRLATDNEDAFRFSSDQ